MCFYLEEEGKLSFHVPIFLQLLDLLRVGDPKAVRIPRSIRSVFEWSRMGTSWMGSSLSKSMQEYNYHKILKGLIQCVNMLLWYGECFGERKLGLSKALFQGRAFQLNQPTRLQFIDQLHSTSPDPIAIWADDTKTSTALQDWYADCGLQVQGKKNLLGQTSVFLLECLFHPIPLTLTFAHDTLLFNYILWVSLGEFQISTYSSALLQPQISHPASVHNHQPHSLGWTAPWWRPWPAHSLVQKGLQPKPQHPALRHRRHQASRAPSVWSFWGFLLLELNKKDPKRSQETQRETVWRLRCIGRPSTHLGITHTFGFLFTPIGGKYI